MPAEMKGVGHLPYRFCVGDTHIHSTVSDGDLSPSEIAITALHNGLDFCAVSDHHTTRGSALAKGYVEASGLPLTVLTAQEVQCEDHVHFVFLGVGSSFPAARFAYLPELADYVHAQGGAVILAHPWTAFNKPPQIVEQLDWFFARGKIDALEVFTSSLKAAKFPLWSRMAEHYRQVWIRWNPGVIASSDWHHRNHGLAVGLGHTYVKVNTPSEGGIVAAIKAGRTVAAVSKSLAQEAGILARLQETLFLPGAEGEPLPDGPWWRENFFGPPDLVNELIFVREEARALLTRARSDSGAHDAVFRAAASAFAAGNYSRALELMSWRG